jgi:hypothetical protein
VGASLLAKASAHSTFEVSDKPPSRAGSLPQFESSTSARNRSAVRPPSLASQLPQGRGESGRERLAVETLSRAGSLPQFESSTSARNRSAVRPPSLASQLPQKSKSKIKRSQPSAAPTVGLGTTSRSGRLSGRHREQAHSYKSKGKAAQLPAAKPPHSTMSVSSSALDLDPPATSEG